MHRSRTRVGYKIAFFACFGVLGVMFGGAIAVASEGLIGKVEVGSGMQFEVDLRDPYSAADVSGSWLQPVVDRFRDGVDSRHLPAIGNELKLAVGGEESVVVAWVGEVNRLSILQTPIRSWGFEGERVAIEIDYAWNPDQSTCLMVDFESSGESPERQTFWSCTESLPSDAGQAMVGHNRLDFTQPGIFMSQFDMERSWPGDYPIEIDSWVPHALNIDGLTADCALQDPRSILLDGTGSSAIYARTDHCFPIEVGHTDQAITMGVSELIENPPPNWIGYGGTISIPSVSDMTSWNERASIEIRSCHRIGQLGCGV